MPHWISPPYLIVMSLKFLKQYNPGNFRADLSEIISARCYAVLGAGATSEVER